jgi:hypothetical protein
MIQLAEVMGWVSWIFIGVWTVIVICCFWIIKIIEESNTQSFKKREKFFEEIKKIKEGNK